MMTIVLEITLFLVALAASIAAGGIILALVERGLNRIQYGTLK